MAKRVVALMGSHHKGGTIDRVVAEALAGAREGGAETLEIDLHEHRVEFCLGCRACCARPGPRRGRCVQHDDDVDPILTALETADAVILGAPVRFDDLNALTRRLLERMLGYTTWPPGQPAPRLRDRRRDRPALLITSSAAPALLTRLFTRAPRSLRRMAQLLGTRPIATLIVGQAGAAGFHPPERARRRAHRLGRGLAHAAGAPPPRGVVALGAER